MYAAEDFFIGIDAIGAEPALPPGPYVVIHVNNIPALVKAQGGASGELVARLAPETIQAKVYNDMASEMVKGLKAQGVDATVVVANSLPGVTTQKLSGEILLGLGIGGGIVGLAWVAKSVISHLLGKKKA